MINTINSDNEQRFILGNETHNLDIGIDLSLEKLSRKIEKIRVDTEMKTEGNINQQVPKRKREAHPFTQEKRKTSPPFKYAMENIDE